MPMLQCSHWCDGTQVGISGENYKCLITTDNAPCVMGVQEGKGTTEFHLETGDRVVKPDWLLAAGKTEEEAWEEYWEDHLQEAPQWFLFEKRKERLIRKLMRVTDPDVIDALEKIISH